MKFRCCRYILDSLFGRLVLLLSAALIFALVAGVLQAEHERARQWQKSRMEHVARRSADLAYLFDRQTPERRQELAKLLSLPWLRIEANFPYLRHLEPLETSDLHDDLNETLSDRTWFIFSETHHLHRALLQIQLHDGSWLSMRLMLGYRPPRFTIESLGQFGLMMLIVLFAGLGAARWLTRPLEMFAQAAEGYARNRHQAPLAVRGSREVREAALAFNRMQEQLNEQIDGRAQSFAAMSHDLKTPLTRLRLRAEMLDEPDRSRMIGDLDEMQAVIQETLDFLRDDHEGKGFERVDMSEFLAQFCANWRELGHEIPIFGDIHRPISTIPTALRRILDNLIQNAILYAKNPSVWVHDTKDFLEISVCDEGAGIPESELESVFQAFYRLETSRNRASGGSGLGLASARRLSHALRGELRLSNRETGGVCAQLRLNR